MLGHLVLAGALREDRAGPGWVRWGGWVGVGGVGRGGILNISLFGVISPVLRPNGVFFGLFWPFFGVFGPPPGNRGFCHFWQKSTILDQNFDSCHKNFRKVLLIK